MGHTTRFRYCFLGLPVLSMLVFRYLTKARCKRCGGQAQFRAMLPSQYTCKACGAVHHTRISPVSLGNRLRHGVEGVNRNLTPPCPRRTLRPAENLTATTPEENP